MGTINQELIDVEKRFLSYLFHDKKYIIAAIPKVDKEFLPEYGKIYSLICFYFKKFKDIITDNVVDMQFKKKNIDSESIVKYKTMISEIKLYEDFNDGEFASICEELLEKYQRRECIKIAEKIVSVNPNTCNSSEFEKIKEQLKTSMQKINKDNTATRKEGSVHDSIKERMEYYKRIKEHPEELNFITSGFRHVDELNGGFKPGELVLVTGRKGDGKSVCLLNMGYKMWEAGKNVIIFSLEIPKEDYERRFDSLAAEVPSNGLKRGMLTEEEEKRYFKFLENQQNNLTLDGNKCGTLYIVDHAPGMTTAFIESKVEEIETKLSIKFDVIITDYLGIMKDNLGSTEKRHIFGNISLDLKTLARERQCIVITAAQKNRSSVQNGNKTADTSAIAESDTVADNIDWGIDIMSLSEDYGKIESFKTRDGQPFKFTFKKQYSMFRILELESGSAEDAWDAIK